MTEKTRVIDPKAKMDAKRLQRLVKTRKHKRQLRLISFKTMHGFVVIGSSGKNRQQRKRDFMFYKERLNHYRNTICTTAKHIAERLKKDIGQESGWNTEVKTFVKEAISVFEAIAKMEKDYTCGDNFLTQVCTAGDAFIEQTTTFGALRSYVEIANAFQWDVFNYRWEC